MRIHSLLVMLLVGGLSVFAAATASCTQAPQTTPAAPAAKVAVPAPSVAGAWSWTVATANGNPVAQSVVLKQDGEKITGTFTGGYDNTTVDIKEGKIHDGHVMLTVVRPFNTSQITFNFDGTFDGKNTITGKVNWTNGDTPNAADWNAKRGT